MRFCVFPSSTYKAKGISSTFSVQNHAQYAFNGWNRQFQAFKTLRFSSNPREWERDSYKQCLRYGMCASGASHSWCLYFCTYNKIRQHFIVDNFFFSKYKFALKAPRVPVLLPRDFNIHLEHKFQSTYSTAMNV